MPSWPTHGKLSFRRSTPALILSTMRKSLLLATLCSLGLGLGLTLVAHAQTPRTATPSRDDGSAPDGNRPTEPESTDARWQASFAAFEAADRLQAPATGGVLFVGSSSIRLWSDLEQRFAATAPVLKRGFGGSRMLDCARHVDRLVLPYRPRLVVVYAGDNDLAEGRTPQQVLESFQRFVAEVRRPLPETRIAFLSIKPSPLRARLLRQVAETNALVRAYSDGVLGLEYIDVHSPMLDAAGLPRAELFLDDRLHLNDQGYGLWFSVIDAHMRRAEAATSAALGQPAAQRADGVPLKTEAGHRVQRDQAQPQ